MSSTAEESKGAQQAVAEESKTAAEEGKDDTGVVMPKHE